MKRMSLLLMLAGILLSTVAWPDSSSLGNERGTIWISNSGIVSRGSQLVLCDGLIPRPGESLGSVSFVIGPLLSGSPQEWRHIFVRWFEFHGDRSLQETGRAPRHSLPGHL